MKKTIYLKSDLKWAKFVYSDLSELNDHTDCRTISLGNNVSLGDGCRIGNFVSIGNDVSIGKGTIVNDDVSIGDNTIIGNKVLIGYGGTIGKCNKIGNNVLLGNNLAGIDNPNNIVEFSVDLKIGNMWGSRISIGDNVSIGDGISLDNEVSIHDNVKLRYYIKGPVHTVVYVGEDKLQIGWTCLKISEWLDNFKEIGNKQGYSEKQIEEYHQYVLDADKYVKALKWWDSLNNNKKIELNYKHFNVSDFSSNDDYLDTDIVKIWELENYEI